MEQAEFERLFKEMCLATFHIDNDEQAEPVVDKYLKNHPELLELHDRQWYHDNCTWT